MRMRILSFLLLLSLMLVPYTPVKATVDQCEIVQIGTRAVLFSYTHEVTRVRRSSWLAPDTWSNSKTTVAAWTVAGDDVSEEDGLDLGDYKNRFWGEQGTLVGGTMSYSTGYMTVLCYWPGAN